MQQYALCPDNFIIMSDGFLGFLPSLIRDAKRKKKSIEQECFDIAYRVFLKKMNKLYKSKKTEDNKNLFYLLAAVVDCKKDVIGRKKFSDFSK